MFLSIVSGIWNDLNKTIFLVLDPHLPSRLVSYPTSLHFGPRQPLPGSGIRSALTYHFLDLFGFIFFIIYRSTAAMGGIPSHPENLQPTELKHKPLDKGLVVAPKAVVNFVCTGLWYVKLGAPF